MSAPTNISIPKARYDRLITENESLRRLRFRPDLGAETWMVVVTVAAACFFAYTAALTTSCCFLAITLVPLSLMLVKRNLTLEDREKLNTVNRYIGIASTIASLACVVIGTFTMNMPLFHIGYAASLHFICLATH